MIEVKIPQEISQYEAKMIGPFTFRQAFCGAGALLIGWGLYNSIGKSMPGESIVPLILLTCVPFGLVGWFKPYGMRFEQFFFSVLFNTLISNAKRFFSSYNAIDSIEKMTSIEDEDEIVTKKGKVKKKKKPKPKKVNNKKARSKYKKFTYA